MCILIKYMSEHFNMVGTNWCQISQYKVRICLHRFVFFHKQLTLGGNYIVCMSQNHCIKPCWGLLKQIYFCYLFNTT